MSQTTAVETTTPSSSADRPAPPSRRRPRAAPPRTTRPTWRGSSHWRSRHPHRASSRTRDGLRVDAQQLRITTADGAVLLNDISLTARPGELVVVLGASGAGKSTLLEALAGIRPASAGTVKYGGHERAPAIGTVGYVPQDDIINTELSVRRTLDYAARLRLSRTTTDDEVDAVVTTVLRDLRLDGRAELPVARLSGGERKRCSIAVEMITRPRVMFLDEPTAGLDPSNDRQLMRLLRQLADRGTTVVLTTHVTANVALCDKVAVLGRGGFLAYAGPVKGALAHFDVTTVDAIYDRIPDAPAPASALPPLEPAHRPSSEPPAVDAPAPRTRRAARGVHHLGVLSRRNLAIHVKNPRRIAPLVAQPVVLSVLLLVIFKAGVFDDGTRNPTAALQLVFILTFNAFLLGLLTSVQEVVKEFPVFLRERMIGVGPLPYVLSKVSFQAPAMTAGVLFMVAVLRVSGRLPSGGASVYAALVLTLVLMGLAGMALGLMTSSLVATPQQATDVLPLWITPQVLFSGALITVPAMGMVGGLLSNLAPVRWGLESAGHTVGLNGVFEHSSNTIGSSLLLQYGSTFDHSPLRAWIVLSVFVLTPLVIACVVLGRRRAVRS